MNIITAIPLTRAKVADTLSYFTSSDIPVGAIVSVPLRSKTIHAIVADIRVAEDLKTEIKSAPYEIRKLGKVKTSAFFPAPFMEAAKKLAHYYAGTVGAVIEALTADTILANVQKIEPPGTPQGNALSRRLNLDASTYAVQGDDDDRMSSWRSLIRQEFARKKSVAFYVPTIEDVEHIGSMLTKGIEGYIFLLHGSLTPKKTLEAWKQIARTKHPIVVIATASFALLPRSDIDTVIIERENGRGWISQKAPYLDLRHALETLAHTSGQVIHRADSMLRAETLRRIDDQDAGIGSPFKWRSISLAEDGLVDTVIIERENGRGWISQKAPYLDLRHALETIAHTSGQVIHRADSMLRAETLRRIDDQDAGIGSPFKWRSISLAEDGLVDMTRKNPRDMRIAAVESVGDGSENGREQRKFRVLSPQLERLIEINRDESAHLFIYNVRRGISPIIVCDDCETIVACNNCSAPVVLHSSKESGKNFFMCHICGERRSAEENCRKCGGWRLSALGIGIERVAETIRSKFPGTDIFIIDSDTTTTAKQIGETLDKFKSKPGSILLGTELALTHLRDKVDHVAVASLDSLFALPDFRIPERIMYTLLRLRALANRSIIIQTRRPGEKVFEYGLKGNISDFYRATLDDRRNFKYPPFSTLIKISIEGKKDPIARMMADVKKLADPHELEVFPAFTSTARGNSIIHGLIRFKPHEWPDSALIAKLKSLPPTVSVRVDPESLL